MSETARDGQACAYCQRPFQPNERINEYGECLDLTACATRARQQTSREKVRAAHAHYDALQRQARRDGLGAERYITQAAANGQTAIPAHIWQRAHGDPVALEAARAQALARLNQLRAS